MFKKFRESSGFEKRSENIAPIKKESIFKNNETKAVIEGDNRKLVIEKIDDETLKITESGKMDSLGYVEEVDKDKDYERVEFVLPITVVQQEIPEEKGNPGVIYLKDSWAYPWGNKSDLPTLDEYKQRVHNILEEGEDNSFHWGLPENIKTPRLAVESGSLASWANKTHFCTEEEAIKRAEELAETTKNLDTPSIESMYGLITPREQYLLKKIMNILNEELDYYDEEVGPVADDWLRSVGFTNGVKSLKDAKENLPYLQEESDNPDYKEADRIRSLVAKSILERSEE